MPTFDLSKFYQLRCGATQFSAVVRTLRKIDVVMKARAHSQLLVSLGLLGAIVVGFLVASQLVDEGLRASLALTVTGLAFVYVVGAFRMLFSKGPPPIGRGLVIFGLVNPGIFIYMAAGSLLGSAGAALDFHTHPAACLVGFVLSVMTILLVLRLTSGMRWKKMMPQEVELAYVERIVKPLLAELPKNARGDVLFNPFRGEWSQVAMPKRERPGYTYVSTADILLRMRLPLDEGRSLKVAIYEYAVSKTKNRKSKYKGTKHSVVVRYDVPLGSGASTKVSEIRAAMDKALAGNEQGAVTVSVADRKLTIYQVKKTGDQSKELLASHLLPAVTVLKTIAFMSRASLPRAATPS